MPHVENHRRLTHAGALTILTAAVKKAEDMKVPQCIAIVDAGGNLLAFTRMDGAKFLSTDSAMKKAITAASSGKPSGTGNPDSEVKMALATDGKVTNLKGGLPIIVDGFVVGAIGVGSGTSEQDIECAQAGMAAIGA